MTTQQEIEVTIAATLERSYDAVGPIQARVVAPITSNIITTADADSRLREEALRLGANAVICVEYERRGLDKTMIATGLAVTAAPRERSCPTCGRSMVFQVTSCPTCGAYSAPPDLDLNPPEYPSASVFRGLTWWSVAGGMAIPELLAW